MLMLDRDRQIVLSVARFGQLSTSLINELHFHTSKSRTPAYRALERLVEGKYLARIERQMIGGTGAGSGQYVYQLGKRGWIVAQREGRYWPYRAVNHHMVAIAEAYVELLRLEHIGRLVIEGFRTEPETWFTAHGVEVRPDMYLHVTDVLRGTDVHLWIEIDMGTERQSRIKEKLADYWHAYEHSSEASMPPNTAVVFIAPDADRAHEINWLIGQGREEQRSLFYAFTADSFARYLFP